MISLLVFTLTSFKFFILYKIKLNSVNNYSKFYIAFNIYKLFYKKLLNDLII